MSSDEEKESSFRAQILDLAPEDRGVRIEMVIDDEERVLCELEQRPPRVKGIALHMHSNVPIVSEDGVEIEERCDYVVLDIMQVMHVKHVLAGISIVDKRDGTPLD